MFAYTQDTDEDIYTRCLDELCSDKMMILQNNSKVLRFLTDSEDELVMLSQSINMAIKHNHFNLVQNILFELKDNIYKLAALEVKYFDEFKCLLKTDIYNTFMPQNFKKHAFIAPALKEIIDILNKTACLSPTNAAFAIKTALDVDDNNFFEKIINNSELSEEFIRQIHKRYHANFDTLLKDELNNNSNNNRIKNFLLKAM